MIKHVFILILLFVKVAKSNSQEGRPGQIRSSMVQVREDDTRHKTAAQRPCLLWLPPGYSDSSNTPFFPLLVFLYGSKQSTSLSQTNMSALKNTGPFHFLSDKTWNGSADYGGRCGQNNFIIFAMQAGKGSANDAKETDHAIGQLLLRFRIDPNRIIISGINEGSATLLHYISDPTLVHQPRLIIPMSVPIAYGDSVTTIAPNKGIKMWAFSFDKDIKGTRNFKANTIRLVDGFNRIVPGSARLTITSGTNCCWNKYFDPTFRQAGTDSLHQPVNIYEWIMKNISWGDPPPPIFACDEFVITPYKLAGWLSAGKKSKKDAFAARCATPVYTINGKISKGSVIYLERSGDNMQGNSRNYGYSPKLKGALATRCLVIDTEGKVIYIE